MENKAGDAESVADRPRGPGSPRREKPRGKSLQMLCLVQQAHGAVSLTDTKGPAVQGGWGKILQPGWQGTRL